MTPGLTARYGGEWRGHLAHRIRAHVDPRLDDHRVRDGLPRRLVLETHRDDDVVAFLDVRLYRLEHIIVGACKCRDREVRKSRKGNGNEKQLPFELLKS